MIKITNLRLNFYIKDVVRGMRNAYNSWDKSDTNEIALGSNDIGLMRKLINGGSTHRKFLRFMAITYDIIAPMYWFKEKDTYKVGTVCNSCSTMHTLMKRPLTLEDFSTEDMSDETLKIFVDYLSDINKLIHRYKNTQNKSVEMEIIKMLPMNFNQKRTYMLNYETLFNIHETRKNHKLEEWRDYCKWIETLPYAELITGGNNGRDE